MEEGTNPEISFPRTTFTNVKEGSYLWIISSPFPVQSSEPKQHPRQQLCRRTKELCGRNNAFQNDLNLC
jgi:hypothetical protein